MGPIRGFKRRKKAEKKVDQNVLDSALASLQPQQPQQPLDWWDDFSRRITGTHSIQFWVLHFTTLSFVVYWFWLILGMEALVVWVFTLVLLFLRLYAICYCLRNFSSVFSHWVNCYDMGQIEFILIWLLFYILYRLMLNMSLKWCLQIDCLIIRMPFFPWIN